MRHDRAATWFALADFADDQRFACLQCLLGNALEFRRRLDRLDQQHKNLGLAFVEHVIDEVRYFERRFVTGGDDMAEQKMPRPGAIQATKAKPAALRNPRNLAAAQRAERRQRTRALVRRGT